MVTTVPKHILFVSLDLLYFKDYSIQDIVMAYKHLHAIPSTQKTYLFLDEVAYKHNFNQELKNLYDLENYHVYASSSSASMLKDNKAFLTGRARYIEINPLGFEVIEMKGKVNERLKAKKKLYCKDVGIRNSITGFRDKGAIYENLVYLALRHHQPNFLYKEGTEIDFCYQDTLIEAKYGQPLTEQQQRLFTNAKYRHKRVASGMDFFLEDW